MSSIHGIYENGVFRPLEPSTVPEGSEVEISPRVVGPKSEAPSQAPRSIWDLFEEVMANLPESELDKLPSDGAEQHDHYIYGTPKRPV